MADSNTASPSAAAAGRERPSARGLASAATRSGMFWIVLVLLLEILIFAVVLPSGTFVSWFNVKTLLADSSVVLIIAAGATLVIIMGGLDLSAGSLATLSAVIAGKLMTEIVGEALTHNQAMAIVVGVAAGICAGGLWGLLNGVLVARVRVPPFVVTLGSLGAALGIARLLSGGVAVGSGPPALQADFGQAEWLGIPAPFVLAAVVALICGLVLAKTRFGEHTYLIGSNEEAARRGGINVKRHQIAIYAIAGALAGLAGVVDLARFDTASVSTGHMTELIAAIAAVVIGGASLFGGTGGMGGTVIGIFIPVVLANGLLIGGIERFWQDVVIGVFLVGAVAFDQWRRDQDLRSGWT